MTERQPRGIRNNNPGNIRLSQTRWQGQKTFQFDTEFVEFETPVLGLRALMKLLLTYHVKHQLDTVESIINRYAPPNENATDAYIASVSRALNVKRRDAINPLKKETLVLLAKAICHHENGIAPGGKWYPDNLYEAAAQLVLKGQ